MKQISLILIALLIGTTMQAKEAYAVLSENNTMLTFYYDDQKESRGGMDITFSSFTDNPWLSASNYGIETVIFDASMDNCYAITSTADWFYNCRKLKTITGLEYFHTSEVTDMREMFFGCSALTNLDLSTQHTENLTEMRGMFIGCEALNSLKLDNLNISKVKFLDSAFYGCKSLTTLDLSSFSTHDYQEMSFLFWDCSNLKTIYVSELWNSENNVYANEMFMDCQNLVGGKGTTYSSEHVDFAYARIDGAGGPGYFTEKNSTNIQVTMQGQRQDSDIFDLFGRKLTSPTKGVNIIGGKKTLVK